MLWEEKASAGYHTLAHIPYIIIVASCNNNYYFCLNRRVVDETEVNIEKRQWEKEHREDLYCFPVIPRLDLALDTVPPTDPVFVSVLNRCLILPSPFVKYKKIGLDVNVDCKYT